MNTAFRMLLDSAGSAGENAIDRIQGLPDAAAQLGDKDYWGSVGILALTGILVVFLILAILIFFFWLMGTIFKAIDKSKAEKKASEDAAKAELPVPAAIEAAAVVDETEDEEELIAVISAAIAAYEGEGNFTIRSVRKRADKNPQARSAWSMAGINGNMRQF
ncbi:MAG: OadG family protein [Oscillospiraceae bacterium]|nr:OadG family protein [Oscillospiraceae bacterium]